MGAGGSMPKRVVVGSGDADDKRSVVAQSTRKSCHRNKSKEIASMESSQDSSSFSDGISTSTPMSSSSPLSSAGVSSFGMLDESPSFSKVRGQGDTREFTRQSVEVPLCLEKVANLWVAENSCQDTREFTRQSLEVPLCLEKVANLWVAENSCQSVGGRKQLPRLDKESAKSQQQKLRRQSLTQESGFNPMAHPENKSCVDIPHSWGDKKLSQTESAPMRQADVVPLSGFEKSSRVSRREFGRTERGSFQRSDSVPLSGFEKSSRFSRKGTRSLTLGSKPLGNSEKSKSLPSLAASNDEHYGFSIGDHVTTAGGLDASGPWELMGDALVVALARKRGYLVVEFETGESFPIKASNLSKLTPEASSLSVSSAQMQKKREKLSRWRDGGDPRTSDADITAIDCSNSNMRRERKLKLRGIKGLYGERKSLLE